MPYATIEHMVARFGERELLQLAKTAEGELDQAKIAQALDDAEAQIDGYLRGRYTLPLASPSRYVETLACDLARYRLYPRPTDEVRKRFEDATKALSDISRGVIQLGAAGKTPAPLTDGPQVSAPERVMTLDKLRDF